MAGTPDSDWAALDAGRVLVHVMTDRARRYFDLERLWAAPGTVERFAAEGAEVLTLDTIGSSEGIPTESQSQ